MDTQSAYNQVARSKVPRSDSILLPLRILNNWVKAVLITIMGPWVGKSVLELCGGRGGELMKWKHARLSYLLFVDNAKEAVEEASRRYTKTINGSYQIEFNVMDCYSDELKNFLLSNWYMHSFEGVSCQFAFHYSFTDRATLKSALANIVCALKVGGVFFGTIPSLDAILRNLEVSDNKLTSFCGEHYNITLCESSDIANARKNGLRYTFRLGNVVPDVPESAIPFHWLIQEARSVGLSLVLHQTFKSFYDEHVGTPFHHDLLQRMKGGLHSSLDPEAAAVFGLYDVFAFRLCGE